MKNLKDFYSNLKINLKKDICKLLDISEATFYNKLNNNSWKNSEKLMIENYINVNFKKQQ